MTEDDNDKSRKIDFENCSFVFSHNKYNHTKERICSWVSVCFLAQFNDIFIDGLPPESFDECADSLKVFMENINRKATRNKQNEIRHKIKEIIGI